MAGAGEVTSDCVAHPVTCVSFTNDGNCTLASCMDSKVRLFDRSSGELLQSYIGHKSKDYKVSCLASVRVVCPTMMPSVASPVSFLRTSGTACVYGSSLASSPVDRAHTSAGSVGDAEEDSLS